MARLSTLLAVSCAGTAAALLGGRALLERLPTPTPATSATTLERLRRWSPDPWRRREASLLLEGAAESAGDRHLQRRLLAHQGWGADPLAALVLKREAQAATALQQPQQAEALWRQLLHRFPQAPASADALYSLGREQPELRQELLRRYPAHPAALAAALEAGPEPAARQAGALHLARWGARWPGADERLQQVCAARNGSLSAAQRGQLGGALAELGDGEAALACLRPDGQLNPAGGLALARTLLRGEAAQKAQAESALVALVRQNPDSPQAEEAVRLLAQQEGASAEAALAQLPARWRDSAPVAAHRALAAAGGAEAAGPAANSSAALEVLRRWPDDPASWDLQWDLARRQLLSGDWSGAGTLLEAIDADQLPPPLAARQRFWLGYVQRQLGQDEAATTSWRNLRLHHPGGYYGWRAAVQLGEGDLRLQPGDERPGPGWQPLASGDAELDRLWRLDQRTEAWEVWRHRRGSDKPVGSRELLLEGRLRQGVGDDWTGLAQLDLALMRLKPDQCALQLPLEQHLHPERFLDAFQLASRDQDLPLPLLLGLAKQESRFTPVVRSSVGAVGLMQLMPDTAAEVAGGPVSGSDLEGPGRNAELGARYLKGLLGQFQGNPLTAVAGYNAGPGAVQGWLSPRLGTAPELWVEAIPFPETRLYVKKVLGNAWSYQERPQPGGC